MSNLSVCLSSFMPHNVLLKCWQVFNKYLNKFGGVPSDSR